MDKWNSEIASSLYRPLKGDLPLRLLLICPGRPEEPLKTELIPTTLEEAQGRYDATSYTWGSPENPELISCGNYQLWVQRNAFHMMLDLRNPDGPRKVWIDAICINQCSLDERASQVAIMHHIYRRAAATWVWMGRPDEHSSAAMTYAATLDAKKLVGEFSYCQYGTSWPRFAEKSYFFDPSFDLVVDANQIRDLAVAIVSFLNRPWFSRVWIQQEASLCQSVRVMCGPNAVNWDNIFALAVGSPPFSLYAFQLSYITTFILHKYRVQGGKFISLRVTNKLGNISGLCAQDTPKHGQTMSTSNSAEQSTIYKQSG